ncbi:MAG TPA: hypothetical protein VE978_11885 [Chitinophagales bacterium]|nr:hypothetical protein [Chitinophagales bacterium]
MATSLHPQQKSKQRNYSTEAEEKKVDVENAEYLRDFQIRLYLSNGKSKVVDFLPFFSKHVKGEYLKYFSPERFKKFIVKHGNIYWGRNEDVIFPLHLLLQNHNVVSEKDEEVLYVI